MLALKVLLLCRRHVKPAEWTVFRKKRKQLHIKSSTISWIWLHTDVHSFLLIPSNFVCQVLIGFDVVTIIKELHSSSLPSHHFKMRWNMRNRVVCFKSRRTLRKNPKTKLNPLRTTVLERIEWKRTPPASLRPDCVISNQVQKS